MSIDYTLYLTRAQAPTVPPSELVWAAVDTDDEPAATYTEEDHGIRSTYYVMFSPDKWAWSEAHVALADMVGEILLQADDDVLLLMNGELPVLRRTGGRTVISSRSEWTTPERLSAFKVPVEMADLGGVH